MSDTSLGPLDLPPPVPNTYNPIFSTSGMKPGMVVAASATPNHVVPADASDASTAYVTGMFLGPAPSTAGERGNTRYVGIVSLAAAEWEAATEEGTTLTPGVPYYTSASAPGKITKTVPSAEGDLPAQVGVAMSPLSIMVQIGAEGIAGPPGPPGSVTTEHINFQGGAAANPAVNVTFQEDGTSGAAAVTLADGPSDGFEKTILVTSLNDGAITITPANYGDGTSIHVNAGTFAAVVLVWNNTDGLWQTKSLLGASINP